MSEERCDRCVSTVDVKPFDDCEICGTTPLCTDCRILHRQEIADSPL